MRVLLFLLSRSLRPRRSRSLQPLAPAGPAVAAQVVPAARLSQPADARRRTPDERVEPASLTKLMTAYLTFAALKQKHIEPAQVVPVSERAWKAEGSRMFIEPRKPVTVDELMRGMIVQSGNDACIALAEPIARQRRSVRADDEPRSAAARHEEHQFHELRPACRTRSITRRRRIWHCSRSPSSATSPSTIRCTR